MAAPSRVLRQRTNAREAARIVRDVSAVASVPVFIVLVGVAVDLWVYSDAKTRAASGNTVVFRAGDFVLDSPESWAIGCLILWVVFFPLYLASRT